VHGIVIISTDFAELTETLHARLAHIQDQMRQVAHSLERDVKIGIVTFIAKKQNVTLAYLKSILILAVLTCTTVVVSAGLSVMFVQDHGKLKHTAAM
jgi:hypothetical protein